MATNRVWMFACLIFCKTMSTATSIKQQTSLYQLRRDHIDRQLSDDDRRITEVIEKCEAADYSTDQNKNTECEYIDKVYSNVHFQPQGEMDAVEHQLFARSAIIGSVLEFTFIREPPSKLYSFVLKDGQHDYSFESLSRDIEIWIDDSTSRMGFLYEASSTPYYFPWRTYCPSVQCKISIVIEDGYVQILANDQMISGGIHKVPVETFRRMSGVQLKSSDDQVKLKSIKYTR